MPDQPSTFNSQGKIGRRALVKTFAAAPFVHLGRAQDRPLNLLYLIADDHAGYVLGAQGNKLARTPNLDRLASEGTRFASNFCNSPVCTPSRQSIITGQMPHSAGVTVLSTPLSETKPTIAKHLSAKGLDTAVFGKMHFNRPGQPGLHGFRTADTEDVVQKRWLQAVGPASPPAGVKVKPAWRPFRDPASIWLNADALPFPRPYAQMKSTWVADQACQYLQAHKDNPFALWVSFQEPHSPFDFPLEDRNKFDPSKFPIHPIGPDDHAQIPVIFRDLSPAERQGIAAAYYTSVSFLDRNIGVVLRKLQDLKLTENTLVIYMADHGYSLGQHGRFEKHCMFDPAMHVPLMFRLPGRVKPGVVHDLTESVDVGPTILDLLGAEPFAKTHGQSLRPYLEGSRPAQPKTSVFSEYLENEEACVRTERWKFAIGSGRRFRTDGYINDEQFRWALSRGMFEEIPLEQRRRMGLEISPPSRSVRLFDLQADPGELNNVAAKHPEVAAEMSKQLLARLQQTHPDAKDQPSSGDVIEQIEWYLRPRDAKPRIVSEPAPTVKQ